MIAPNIPSLEAVREMVYKASGASSYGNQHHEVDSYADVAQICKLLVQEDVFTFRKGRGTAGADDVMVEEVLDLFSEGIGRLSTGVPLRQYKNKCRASWGLGKCVDDSTEVIDAFESEVSEPGVLDES